MSKMSNMKNLIKKRKALFFSLTAFLIAVGAVVLFIILPSSNPIDITVSGEAEAVLTTKLKVNDGIWEQTRHSDEFYRPMGIAINEKGELVVADYMCDRIQIIGENENTRIGSPERYGLSYADSGALVDGLHADALFMKPSGVFAKSDGNLLVADTGNHVIRRVCEQFVITIAGNGTAGYANGKEHEARFNQPMSVVMGSDGLIYVADTMNHCIRTIDKDGNVSLYAGTPEQHGFKDGALENSMFYEPVGLTFSEDGVLYVADSANHSVRKIENGQVTTVAGAPGELDRSSGYPHGDYVDGSLSEARFNFPRDVAVLPSGQVAVSDSMNHSIRLITLGEEAQVITIAGGGMSGMYYLSAENIKLTRPEGICISKDGEHLYISDSLNNRVVTLPLTERILAGRPPRNSMLSDTGLSTDSRYSYNSEIRVFAEGERVDMGRVEAWNNEDHIFVPIRPLFEALGAVIELNESNGLLSITVDGQSTVLALDSDYFVLKGIMVTTLTEIERLFPYYVEWFPEFSVIAFSIPHDLKGLRS